jgi:hypothetical protein
MKKLILALLLLAAGECFAQPAVSSIGNFAGLVNIKPQAAPTSLTAVTTYDSSVIAVTVTNTAVSALTFTLQSRETVPVALLSAVSIAPNTTYVVSLPYGHWMVNGMSVQASGAGLIYYIQWRQ